MSAIINVSNIRTWTVDVVANWMRSLDSSLEKYIKLFVQHRIDGAKIVELTHDDLLKLGMTEIGPQALLVEAVAAVMKLGSPYIDSDTLQSYVSNLAVASTCLTEAIQSYLTLLNVIDSDPQNRILYELDKGRYQLDVYSCVVSLIDAARDALSWLSRTPFFHTQNPNVETETMILKDSIFAAVRDIIKKFISYSDNLSDKMSKIVDVGSKCLQDIKETSLKLSTTCERYVTHFKDSLAVIPCQIALLNLKKPLNDSKWGITLLTLNNPLPTHIISDVNEDSSAFGANKIQRGDEILAVGDTPVVCLPHNLVINLIEQSPCDLQLILKKRPAHTGETQRKHWKNRIKPSKMLSRKSQNRSSQGKKKTTPHQTSQSVPSTPNATTDNPPLIEDIEIDGQTPPVITFTEAFEDVSHSRQHSAPNKSGAFFPSTIISHSDRAATLESPKKRLGSQHSGHDYKRVSCRLLGNGECSGWLSMKKKSSSVLPDKWIRRYCILKHHTLYFYKTENEDVAEGLINLRSYDIKVTPGESSKPDRFPFNIQSQVSFTFAADTESNRTKWMNKLGLVAIGYSSQMNDDSQIAGFHKPYTMSETGSSSDSDHGHEHAVSSSDEDVMLNDTPVVARKVINPRPLTRILEGADEAYMTEIQKRESDLLRKLLTVKRLERELKERQEQFELLQSFLSGTITKSSLATFMDAHGRKLLQISQQSAPRLSVSSQNSSSYA